MLARKSQLQSNKYSSAGMTMEKSRLNQARTLAGRRNDQAEVAVIDKQLEELAAKMAEFGDKVVKEEGIDLMAKVNERNRKANLEAVRRAELQEAERRRRERKLAARSGGTPVPSDPSARLKT